jgi:two-component system response regulator DesR
MIRLVVADDQTLLRLAICELLERDPELTVVASCGRGDEVEALVAEHQPDVAVLDIDMPGKTGLEAAEDLAQRGFATRVLMLTVFGRPGYLRRAMQNGAMSFLLKDSPPAVLVDAIKRTAAGERVVDPELAMVALSTGENPLTPREREVLRLSTSGASTQALAGTLHLSEGTVRNTLSAAMQKLSAESRTEAARIAEDNGWL